MVWVAICYQSNAIRKFNRLLGYADSKDCHAKQHRKTNSISPLPNTLLHRIYDTDGSKWWSIGANTHDGMCSRGHKKLWSVPQRFLQADNIINNNNSHDNVYGAVIMTKVIAGVHPVHLMDVDWAPGGRQPSDQASRLGLWVRRKLAAIIHIHHRHCYYYSAYRLILILPSHEGWKAESTRALQ